MIINLNLNGNCPNKWGIYSGDLGYSDISFPTNPIIN